MGFPPHTPGFGFYTVANDVVAGLAFIIGFVVVVGLIVLLVRFLLVATKAAELYIANNRPADPQVPTATATATSAPPATPVVVPAAAAKPTPRTRSPKPPTS
jgi:hypothetical protein